MKRTFITLLTIALFAWACEKDSFETVPLASLRIVNVVTGGGTILLGSQTPTVANNANRNYTVFPDNPNLYVYPMGDSLHPWYNPGKSVLIEENQSYTLFLGGAPEDVLAKLVKEAIPIRDDSTAGVRFINLSPNSVPVNVTLSTTSTVSEFFNIGYGDITDFKSFPATASNTSYTFQVRNATTNTVITSITMSGTSTASYVPRFRNVTLVLRGKIGGSPAAGMTRVNHY